MPACAALRYKSRRHSSPPRCRSAITWSSLLGPPRASIKDICCRSASTMTRVYRSSRRARVFAELRDDMPNLSLYWWYSSSLCPGPGPPFKKTVYYYMPGTYTYTGSLLLFYVYCIYLSWNSRPGLLNLTPVQALVFDRHLLVSHTHTYYIYITNIPHSAACWVIQAFCCHHRRWKQTLKHRPLAAIRGHSILKGSICSFYYNQGHSAVNVRVFCT